MIVADTSFLYALLDGRDARHAEAASWYRATDAPLATTPLILAELDHLAATRAGPLATRAFRRDVAAGAYAVEWWTTAPAETVAIADRYDSLGLGLADASLLALAARLEVVDLATFDERHFRVVRPAAHGDAFRLLPVDAPPA